MKMRHLVALIVLVWATLLSSHPALAQFSQQGPKLVAHAAGAAPSAFSLQSPANRSASESTTTAFSWGFSSGDATYTLEVATDAGFGAANVVNQSGLTTTSYTLPTPLTPGVVHFWRVTATNAGGALAAANGPFEFSAPIPVGSGFPGSLAVTPDGTRVLVARGDATNGFLADVSVAGHAVTQAIPVGIAPAGVAIRSDGQEAVVASSIGHSVSVVNLTNNTVKATIAVPCVGTTLYDVAYTPDGIRIVLPDLSNGCGIEGLRLITLATGAQTFVNISGAGNGVAVMPNGDSALNTRGILGTTLRRMNLASSAVVTINNTSSSFGVAVTPDSSQAIVASGEGDTIKRINLATNTVVGATPFGSNQDYHNVAITPDGSQAVVVGDFNTALISLTTDTVVTLYPDGGSNVAISPDGKSAYISAYVSGNNVLLKVIRIPVAPRGDANGDGLVTVGDVFYLINYLFAGGPAPIGSGDANGDSSVTVSDVFYLINYLFAGGPPPH